MKHTLLAALAFISLSTNAYYEDNQRVQALADSGKAILEYESSDCEREPFETKLGLESGYSAICVKEVKLPVPVSYEVILMKEYELENDSDYDSRLTELRVFEGRSFSPNFVDLQTARKLFESFSIKLPTNPNFHFQAEEMNSSSFSEFEGLFIGYDFIEAPMSVQFLRNLLKGETAQRISFTEGVELYPGGGFNVTHHLILVKGKLIYLKNSWWDA